MPGLPVAQSRVDEHPGLPEQRCYTIAATGEQPEWARAEPLRVDCFHPASSDHRPLTTARAVSAAHSLWVRFDVQDRYVRSVCTRYLDPVCSDSCVEFFVQPGARGGYFNFEVNCGGTLLLYYIEDWRRTDDGFERYRPVTHCDAEGIVVSHTLPQVVEPEIGHPVEWSVVLRIPLRMLERYVGHRVEPAGTWRGNFYKCADNTSHPHWASWSPIGDQLDFHQPERFGTLILRGQ